jgi:peptidoglycan/xylan/chitin deacetylase (PgdA/CDA1 family)
MNHQIILNFHGLGDPPEFIEPAERPYWISAELFEDLVARTASRPEVTYSFDDGNLSDLTLAAPALRRHRRVGDFFILTGRLGSAGYLGPKQLQELRDMGMGIGLHGRDHVDWRKVTDKVLEEETVQARQTLSEAAGQPIESVSIPFGAYNRSVVSHLISQGFSEIFTSDGGRAAKASRVKSRTSIRSNMSAACLDEILAGRSSPVANARRVLSTFLRRHVI